MPQEYDWRFADACTCLDDFGSTAFAWEFLRRNSDYHQTYRSIAHEAEANPEFSEPVAQRWGLRFRCRSGPPRRPRQRRVAASPPSRHCSCRAGPRQVRRGELPWRADTELFAA